jgi:hypothetical protein
MPSDTPTNKFGEVMKQQVEDRLRFYEEGVAPEKNIDVMKRVLAEVGGGDLADGDGKKVRQFSFFSFELSYGWNRIVISCRFITCYGMSSAMQDDVL